MKNIYVCDKCGAQFVEDQEYERDGEKLGAYDACWQCEHSHVEYFCTELESEMRKHYQYRAGSALPHRIIVANRIDKWNEETKDSETTYNLYAYKLAGPVPESESAEILAEFHARRAEEDAYWEQRRIERERKLAEEAANAEGQATA